MSMTDFATAIRQKFGAYNEVPDGQLVAAMLAKYPVYKDQVTLDPRTEIAMRKANPPATATGDPNAQPDIGVGDVLGAAGKGIAHLAGIPTSMAEVPGAVKTWLTNVASGDSMGLRKTIGDVIAGVSAPARAYASGQAPTAEQNAGAIPIIGRPALETARPAIAYSHGNAPTRADNLGAIESGTSLAGMAAMTHPAVAGAIERVLPSAGAAMEASGKSQYADALAPAGSASRPLAESLGSQLADNGTILRNPKKQLGTAFGGTEDIAFRFDKSKTSLKDLQAKYPGETITEDGQNYTVHQPNDGQLNQQAANKLAADMPAPEVQAWWQKAAQVIVPGGIGAKVGAMIGGAPGAAIGAAVGELPYVANAVVKSPLWNTASGVVKTSLGKAMMAQDAAAVTTIAARILGGVNLEDAYGHDAALHKLVSSLPTDPVMLHQALGNYAAVYENPDGSHVQVPYHVQKRTNDAIAGQ